MTSPQTSARGAILQYRVASAPARTAAQLLAAIKIEARVILCTQSIDQDECRPLHVTVLRRELVAAWPDIRRGRVGADEISANRFYTIAGNQGAALAILIAARRARA